MKRILAGLLILISLMSFSGCSSNAVDSNYENTDPNNQMERLYEEEEDDAGLTAAEGNTGFGVE